MLKMTQRVESADNSVKYSFINENNQSVEAMYFTLPFQSTKDYSYSICISSQAGCAVNCSFCATGKGGFFSHLTSDEMHHQITLIQEDIIARGLQDRTSRFHISFMGMGEPLLNYAHVTQLCGLLQKNYPYLNKISLSTVGIIPKITMLSKNSDINIDLFVSIHSPYDEQRTSMIPINKKYPLASLMDACRQYAKTKNTFVNASYLLIHEFNDSEQHAIDFCKLLDPRYFRVQILMYNKINHSNYQRPLDASVNQFKNIVDSYHLQNMVIASKGQDINGGCGQLVAKEKILMHNIVSEF